MELMGLEKLTMVWEVQGLRKVKRGNPKNHPIIQIEGKPCLAK
jgi:hypothetical protein